jgi:hypothetical protein
MSVTRVHKHSSRARRTKDGPELTETWLVICDDLTDGAEVAIGGAGLPTYGTTKTMSGKLIYARDLNATPADSKAGPKVFNVEVQYRTADSSEDQEDEDPLARPAVYSYPDDPTDEAYAVDVEGEPVTNSAGVPPQTLPTRLGGDGLIRVRRNVASFNDQTATGFRRKINSGNVTINGVTYNARRLLIKSWTADGPHQDNGVSYWTESIDILKKADGWDLVYPDQGRSELNGDNRIPIRDAQGRQVEDDWPLDGAGGAKAAATDAPAELTRKPYEAVVFPSF